METNLIQQLTDTFEGHAQQTETGVEDWLAREQRLLEAERVSARKKLTDTEKELSHLIYEHLHMFFTPISRWAIAPVFQLLDIRRELRLSPFGYQFVSLEDLYRCAYEQIGGDQDFALDRGCQNIGTTLEFQ